MSNARHQWEEVVRLAISNGKISFTPRLKDLATIAKDAGWSGVPLWFRQDSCPYKVGRGQYDLSPLLADQLIAVPASHSKAAAPVERNSTPAPEAILQQSLSSSESIFPEVDPDFVRWGNFENVLRIIESRMFYPIYITGLSGNGKTAMVQQACAAAKRECYRVNVTSQTDEDDLLGGFRLVDGETVWYDGPVIQAMKAGAVLLLDEVDLGSSPLMCLQPVLEGNGIFLKKINQFVKPAPGFTVIATANTKGKGDETGAFSHTGMMNEAFLDRFPVTLEQDYAGAAVEKRILTKKMKTLDIEGESDFASSLTVWAKGIRETFLEGGVSEIITTRRLLSIVRAFAIFKDRRLAIEMAISRFDAETKADFIRLYEKIDASITPADGSAETPTPSSEETTDDFSCPF